ncbi:MAG: PorV/PorQ family protein [candidate division Zixibacteria bacterium]|nr:PorV/PorQ family protein [candidate division Zixibacteria bacterium]
MKYKYITIVSVLLVAGCTSVFAGSSRKIGTAGAQELLLPIGSRGTAMGGAVIANSYGLESIFWNPSGLASLEGSEAMFSHQTYLADMDVNFGGVATTFESFGTVGVTAKVLSVGDIEETTDLQPDGTGNIYAPTLTVIGLTYAKNLTASVAFGATAMFINESIFQVNARGVAFDFGVTYRPNWNGVTLGIAIKNYGPSMRFSGSGFQRVQGEPVDRTVASNSASFELPSSVNLGMAYNFFNSEKNSASLSGNFRSNNFSEDLWQGGAEYSFSNRYFLRGGYNFSSANQYLYGLSLGAGLNFAVGEESTLSLEYAWNETEVFDDNQYFTLRVGF